MKTILFLDNTYPRAYQSNTLLKQAIGGTEASVLRTAKILSQSYRVLVAQKFRDTVTKESSTLIFIPKTNVVDFQFDIIVVLRKYNVLKKMSQQFPKAQLFLWLHTYKNWEYAFIRIKLAKVNFSIICNSNIHRIHTYNLINKGVLARLLSLIVTKIKVHYCYNPIPIPTINKFTKDLNKLLFLSSPNKGLNQILQTFKNISKSLPQLKLYIANPGYKNDKIIQQKNTIILGSLSHHEMMQHVSESLCVFYPQDSFAETFGLIYAEANACAVPVLAHDIGAAREVLDKNNPLIDAQNINQISEMIIRWQNKYPKISYNENFSDKTIFNQWKQLIEE